MNRLLKKLWYIRTQIVYKAKFKYIGKNSLILHPLQLDNTGSIVLENDVYIAEQAWLMGNNGDKTTLKIQAGCTIGHFAHIIAKSSVTIESNTLIADRVFISDCTHNYADIEVPIKKQEIKVLGDVRIGEGSWIGENVCILGHSVGKHSVIGANSVVTIDIPNYTVAAGNPAKIIKQYNKSTKMWEKVNK